jgi:enoyl-CoA hydratase/carnithine racemase
MNDDDPVLLDIDEGVATVTLNLPESLNAWTPEMEQRWNDTLDLIAAHRDVRAVVVTGAGRGFCSGADTRALGRRARGEEARPARERPLSSVVAFPKPVIAAVNGPCVGLGLALALSCDVRFASTGATFGAPFARLGLPAELDVDWLLPRLVGTGRALDLLLSARMVSAEEALSIGLVERVLPKEELLASTTNYAVEIARACSPEALAAIKRQVARAASDSALAVQPLADFTEGIKAAAEHRAPRFPPLTVDSTWWRT